MTITFVGSGSADAQRVRRRPPSRAVSSANAPLLMTSYRSGAVTVNATVALSLGWSTTGSQWRARFGQLSPKKVRSPCWFSAMMSPSAGWPL